MTDANFNPSQVESKPESISCHGSSEEVAPCDAHTLALLRKRFLQGLIAVNGRQAMFHLYEGATTTSVYRGCNKNMSYIQVSNLHTPIGVIDEGLLRTTDVLSMSMHVSSSTK